MAEFNENRVELEPTQLQKEKLVEWKNSLQYIDITALNISQDERKVLDQECRNRKSDVNLALANVENGEAVKPEIFKLMEQQVTDFLAKLQGFVEQDSELALGK